MNNEVKEILDSLYELMEEYKEDKKICPGMGLNWKDWTILLDYITNLQQENEKDIEMLNDIIKEQDMKLNDLQQENERLKELVNPKTQIFIDTQDMEERYGEELYKEYLEKQLEDFKSRIDKAIEYIENEDIDVCMIRYNDIYDTKKELLNILRGV